MHAKYVGSELEIFASASHWRSYWAKMVEPHLGQNVLEVGAGIGSVTKVLSSPANFWTALEPDPEMVHDLSEQSLPPETAVVCGTIDDLGESASFDSVLYIDVLEHIEDDKKEIVRAAELLRPGGKLIVLAPAHHFLFSPFDSEVGHFRRYSLRALEGLRPAGFRAGSSRYLDSLGVLASVANKVFLRQARPTVRQIRFWDRYVIPVSRFVDPLLFYRVGKSALVVWVKLPLDAGS